MLVKATTLLTLLAAVKAISITQPTDNTKWNGGETTTITWTSVSTDEDTFNLAIKDKNNDVKIIAENVDTNSHSYSYTPDANADGDFNIQILSAKKNQQNAILAESGFFEIQPSTNANAAQSSDSEASASATSSADAKTSFAIPNKLTSPSADIKSGAAGQTLSMSAGENQPSAQATNGNTNGAAAAPSGSAAAGTKEAGAASALVPSLALVGGSLLAALL